MLLKFHVCRLGEWKAVQGRGGWADSVRASWANGGMDTTLPIIKRMALNSTSAGRAHRRHPVGGQVPKHFCRARRLIHNHTDKQTDNRHNDTYIQNPEGQTDRASAIVYYSCRASSCRRANAEHRGRRAAAERSPRRASSGHRASAARRGRRAPNERPPRRASSGRRATTARPGRRAAAERPPGRALNCR